MLPSPFLKSDLIESKLKQTLKRIKDLLEKYLVEFRLYLTQNFLSIALLSIFAYFSLTKLLIFSATPKNLNTQ